MARLIAIAALLIPTSSAHALPLATLHQPDQIVTKVREAALVLPFGTVVFGGH
jgi:hypothetical protein